MPASADATRKQALRYYPTAQRAGRGSMSRCSPAAMMVIRHRRAGVCMRIPSMTPEALTRTVQDSLGWTNGGDRAWRVVLGSPNHSLPLARGEQADSVGTALVTAP